MQTGRDMKLAPTGQAEQPRASGPVSPLHPVTRPPSNLHENLKCEKVTAGEDSDLSPKSNFAWGNHSPLLSGAEGGKAWVVCS